MLCTRCAKGHVLILRHIFLQVVITETDQSEAEKTQQPHPQEEATGSENALHASHLYFIILNVIPMFSDKVRLQKRSAVVTEISAECTDKSPQSVQVQISTLLKQKDI